MKNSFLMTLSPLALAALTACGSATNPQLGQAVQPGPTITASSRAAEAGAVPKVDILFVADDSDSMTKHLADVQANLNSFTTAFAGQANVDYHVGLVKVYDSTRYGTPKVPVFVANGEMQNDELDKQLVRGLLAKTPAASEADQKALIENSAHWMERSQKDSDTLTSLRMLLNFKTKTIANGGPNKEEIFSPIAAALSEPALSSPRNRGFYRPEANLAIIILTDAEDSSPNTTAEELKTQLLNLKDQQAGKISIYAALAGTTCTMDIDHELPAKIKSLVGDSHRVFNLCGNFGSTMAAVGKDIVSRLKVDNVIPLPAPPSSEASIVVSYGAPGAPQAVVPHGGWVYSKPSQSITVNPAAVGLPLTPGGKFTATYRGYSDQELKILAR